MKFELRNRYFSYPRYNRYLNATAHNKERANKLYYANIRLTQAFHPILGQFEVILRNSINTILSVHFTDPNWIINQKTGFMQHPSLEHSKFFLKSCVQKTERKLIRRNVAITSGKIISDQTFGFWSAFFLAHHYSLVGGQPIHIFTNKPSLENRASIYASLDEIKNFRNRVSHCEPLCFNGNAISCSEALAIRVKLYNLIEWIDPNLVPFFEKIDTVTSKINRVMAL